MMNAYKRPRIYKRTYAKMVDTIRSTILCIRFPFLYPRNRFSGLHYHNFALSEAMRKQWQQAYETGTTVQGDGKIHIYKKLVSRKHLCLYYLIKIWYEYICQFIFCIPSYNELDAGMPKGWRKAFGIQMCKDIRHALIRDVGYKGLFQYRIMQLKEKFGGLRLYDEYSTKAVHDIISQYEAISYYTCIDCGKPAMWHTTGWIVPLCDNCISDKERQSAHKITTTEHDD